MNTFMEILTVLTALIVSLTALIRVANYLIKESSLFADNLMELIKYGWKKKGKDAAPLDDSVKLD